MNLLPKASGTRPRVACEISPQGVVAARSAETAGPLAAVALEELADGAVNPSLRPGNIVDRVAVTAAVRRALEGIGLRPNARDADIGLVLPDGAVRVLLLDFDTLPNKLSEALPIVRFRLKKLLPFEVEHSLVSFQVMSTGKAGVRVLAVAIPRDVLREYETVAREAGFEPGAVLPSTLAALAGLEDDAPALLVNANRLGVTTAIVRAGIVLLHLSVDLQQSVSFEPVVPAAAEDTFAVVNREESVGEWAAQQPLPEHGRNPYADRLADEAAVQNEDGLQELYAHAPYESARVREVGGLEPGALEYSPYASPTLTADLDAELHNAILVAPTSMGTLTEDASGGALRDLTASMLPAEPVSVATAPVEDAPLAEEIAQAVSKGAAYFEDTLAMAPSTILSAGPLGAEALRRVLALYGLAQDDGLRVREVVESGALLADAATAKVSRGWLAGVVGALRG